jgi:GntR family transcriptional regulator/MocR family aminotransferase
MVVPDALAETFRMGHAELYRGGKGMTQMALAEFIKTGQYASHVRNMRLIYGARREFLHALITKSLGADWIHPFDTAAGLHTVLRLPDGTDDAAICVDAAGHGLFPRPLSRYYQRTRNCECGLLLGFASTAPEDMLAAFQALLRCIRSHLG